MKYTVINKYTGERTNISYGESIHSLYAHLLTSARVGRKGILGIVASGGGVDNFDITDSVGMVVFCGKNSPKAREIAQAAPMVIPKEEPTIGATKKTKKPKKIKKNVKRNS